MTDVILNLPLEEVVIDYTNWRGERAMRRIRPLTIRFENTEWHQEAQWLLRAVDIARGATRDFAMRDIHSWKTSSPITLTDGETHE